MFHQKDASLFYVNCAPLSLCSYEHESITVFTAPRKNFFEQFEETEEGKAENSVFLFLASGSFMNCMQVLHTSSAH